MNEFKPEDRLLVARARMGDPQAFRELVFAYTPRLVWFVRKLGLSEAAADDVLQESWLAVWRSFERLKDVRRYRGWLYGIVRNKALQHVAREPGGESRNIDVAGASPDESFFDRYLPYLNQALEALSSVHREVLALRFSERMTYQELAEAIGVSEGTVKSRLHNAKHALRTQLEELARE
ncbi:MAG: RNA polymerase sigma factor [Pirellulaceae bacterium]